MKHIPNKAEEKIISQIKEVHHHEFSLIRVTQTMLNKSTIDATFPLRNLLKESVVFDFDKAIDGEKTYLEIYFLKDNSLEEIKTSFYRPHAKPNKPGDPRIWPSKLNNLVEVNELLYATIFKGKLLLIPLNDCSGQSFSILKTQNKKGPINHMDELIQKIRNIANKPIKSCSPKKKNAKDVGETLELILGVETNNLKSADYLGLIEIKGKGGSKTMDTLFCKVPDKKLSKHPTVKEIIKTFGYQSPKEGLEDYISLFVTVHNKPNPKGLYLEVDYKNGLLKQKCKLEGKPSEVCVWTFQTLKSCLLKKHPKTVWVKAKTEKINGEYHFLYEELEVTEAPLFSEFLLMIEKGEVVFDWRGAIPKKSGKRPIDYGHAFRLSKVTLRSKLFGSHKIVKL